MPLASAGYPRRWLDGVPGGFGVVGAPGWGGPAERPVGQLVDLPAGLLLEPVVVSALRRFVAKMTHVGMGDPLPDGQGVRSEAKR